MLPQQPADSGITVSIDPDSPFAGQLLGITISALGGQR